MINKWDGIDTQECTLGGDIFSVARLITLSKDLEVMSIPLKHLNVFNTYDRLSLRQMVMHIKAVNNADLSYPIILDEDGEIMDGRHRIMKALLNGNEAILAVRFDTNPSPCSSKRNK